MKDPAITAPADDIFSFFIESTRPNFISYDLVRMKIGILTVPFNNNYGGFLQAYALKSVLLDLGHEVIFISRRRKIINIPFFKYLIGFPYYRFMEYKQEKLHIFLSTYTDEFKKKYLGPITEDYFSTAQLKKCLKYSFDAVVVGSDQVWRYRYAKDSIDDFFCNFLRGTKVKRLSYAASFGTDEQEYPIDKLQICSDLIKEFSLVSVREYGGKDILVRYFGLKDRQVDVVLDPTLLLSVDIYKKLFINVEVPKTKYVFTYILDKDADKQKLIDLVCRKKDLIEMSISAQTGDIKHMQPIEPVELWLSRIYYADYVITDSFHGTVFSILFNKPFIVYGNIERGKARFDTLLKSFGLEDRYVVSYMDFFEKHKESYSFNWDAINQQIKIKKEDSINCLVQNL